MQPEPFKGPLTTGFLPGLTVGFVRTRFGRLALGIFFLSEAAARSVGLTILNVHATRWQAPFLLLVAGTTASILVAGAVGWIVQRYG